MRTDTSSTYITLILSLLLFYSRMKKNRWTTQPHHILLLLKFQILIPFSQMSAPITTLSPSPSILLFLLYSFHFYGFPSIFFSQFSHSFHCNFPNFPLIFLLGFSYLGLILFDLYVFWCRSLGLLSNRGKINWPFWDYLLVFPSKHFFLYLHLLFWELLHWIGVIMGFD